MGYVYRYTDLEDNIIKYVGIVWSDNRSLRQRIKEHELNDEWCKNKKWKIEYITENINTKTDAEYFESHYISLFQTGKYYNKNKVGWGTSSFLPDRKNDWITYNDKEPVKQDCESIFKVYIKDNKEFRVELIPVNKKVCKAKNIPDCNDYHCKCGSNELYKIDRGSGGQLHCKECGSWVMNCKQKERLLYSPEYNGEYVVSDGEIVTYEYYSFRANHPSKWEGYRKEELENVISTYAYALTEGKIEEQKLKILRHISEKQQIEIAKLEENLSKLKEEHNKFMFDFGANLNQ